MKLQGDINTSMLKLYDHELRNTYLPNFKFE